MATEYVRFYLQLLNSASLNAIYEVPLDGLNQFVNETYSQLTIPGDRTYTTEELFKFEDVNPGGYKFGIRQELSGSNTSDLVATVAPNNNTDSYIKINKVNQAGDERTIDIPTNMPFGTNGVLQEDFIKSIQTKYNLVIYPSKTKPKEFIIETYNDFIKNYKIKNWDEYVDLSQKMEVIPVNNEGYKKLEFGDLQDVDYVAEQFDKLNNREFGKIYYTDTQNFYSEGEKKVETRFGVSPLVYVQGTGLSGSIDLPTSYEIFVKLGLTAQEACNATAVRKFITRNPSSTGGEPTVGDILYETQYLTQPTTGWLYCKPNTLTIAPIYNISQYTGEITTISGQKCGGI